MLVGVGFCFGMAAVARAFGYSVALGAFLAGCLVAESGAGRQIEREIRPVRDMFAAIFFVAVGMQFDLGDFESTGRWCSSFCSSSQWAS